MLNIVVNTRVHTYTSNAHKCYFLIKNISTQLNSPPVIVVVCTKIEFFIRKTNFGFLRRAEFVITRKTLRSVAK